MHEWAHCHDEAANHQLPIAAAFRIIPIVSTEECWSLVQNLMQIHCSACSVVLNATATQYTGSLNGTYWPQWLVQWSHHCSCLHIPVHCPWLPGYMDVTQTILVLLTMAGIFSNSPRKYTHETITTSQIINTSSPSKVSRCQSTMSTQVPPLGNCWFTFVHYRLVYIS